MYKLIKSTSVLFIISLVAAVSLATVFKITEEPIKNEQIRIRNNSMRTLISDAYNFVIDEDYSLPPTINAVYTATDANDKPIGFIVSSSSMGYGGPVDVFTAFNNKGVIINIDIVSHSETPGLGSLADSEGFKSNFQGIVPPLLVIKGVPKVDTEIEAITSSTITTKAVINSINLSFEFINTYLSKLTLREVSNYEI